MFFNIKKVFARRKCAKKVTLRKAGYQIIFLYLYMLKKVAFSKELSVNLLGTHLYEIRKLLLYPHSGER